MRILVVDDELVSRRKAQMILADYGESEAVNSGVRAISSIQKAMARDAHYDLVTIDIEMPAMSGIELVEKIRDLENKNDVERGRGMKILMLTGSKDPQSILSSFKSGCEACLMKPFDRKALKEALIKLELLGEDENAVSG